MDMKKKFGGTIKNWQTHTLLNDPVDVAKSKELYPEIKTDTIMCFTGTVVEDFLHNWQQGFHMRSSTIISLDRENGFAETFNTIYKLHGAEGGDIFGDIGQLASKIFY